MFDFQQEKEKLQKQITEKEKEKRMEDEIFAHVASYLRETKDKVKKEVGEFKKVSDEKIKIVEERKVKLEKRKEDKNGKIDELKKE